MRIAYLQQEIPCCMDKGINVFDYLFQSISNDQNSSSDLNGYASKDEAVEALKQEESELESQLYELSKDDNAETPRVICYSLCMCCR